LAAARRIGTLAAYSQLTPRSVQRVDAALAVADADVAAVQMGLGAQVGGAPVEPTLGMFVAKSSRTSGFGVGQVSGIDATVNVFYAADDASGAAYPVQFTRQILIDGISPSASFMRSGDSGSVIFEFSTMRAVALGFAAGQGGFGVASPLSAVMEQFFPGNDGEIDAPPPLPPAQQQRKRAEREASWSTFKPSSAVLNDIPAVLDVEHARRSHESLASNAVLADAQRNETLVAHFVGLDADRHPCLFVLVHDANIDNVRQQLPSAIDGVPLAVRYSEPIEASIKN
jgi:hypothetical protein